jgi:uncharacterized membrane protein YraQ (UPF0718 family)
MHNLGQIVSIAWEALVELLPFFVIALLISASVDMLYLDIPARRAFQKHGVLGILFTTALGALSPFCSFTVIPLIRKLLRTGVPLSAVMAFWIASPAMDPPIFALTAKEIGLPLACARLFGALALSIGAGLFVLLLERQGMFREVLRNPSAAELARLTPGREPSLVLAGGTGTVPLASDLSMSHGVSADVALADDSCACAASATDDEDDGAPWWPAARSSLRTPRNWLITGRNMLKDGLSLGKWLVLACIFLGVIRVYLPASLVVNVLGNKGLWAIPIAVVISVPLYLNGVGAIPIVGGLLDKGMAPGAAVTFLLAGAITTIPAMVAVRSVVNNRVFAVYVGAGVVGSIGLGFIAQLLL